MAMPVIILALWGIWDLVMALVGAEMHPMYARLALGTVEVVTAWGLYELWQSQK